MDYPKSNPAVRLHNGKFTDGSADGTVKPSLDPAAWNNAVTDSILEVQAWTGEDPSEGDVTQLRRGIDARIAAAIASINITDAMPVTIKAAAYTLTAADRASTILCNVGMTLSLPAAADLGNGWWCAVRSASAAAVIIDPAGAETIDGAVTLNLAQGESCLLICSGTAWWTVGRSATATASLPGALGLSIRVTGGTAITITADAVTMANTAGVTVTASGINHSVAAGTSGAGGLDTGAITANTWYYTWLIAGSAGRAALLSASVTAPTLPAGYTYKCRLGAVRTDATGALIPTVQSGRRTQYVVPRALASGVAGSVFGPTWAAVAVGAAVPPTAGIIILGLQRNGDSGRVMAAPNNGYGVINANGAPQPVMTDNDITAGTSRQLQASMVLESGYVYWASGGPTNYLMCQGWEDL